MSTITWYSILALTSTPAALACCRISSPLSSLGSVVASSMLLIDAAEILVLMSAASTGLCTRMMIPPSCQRSTLHKGRELSLLHPISFTNW